mgnify:CR=1 FL=1
MLGLALNEFLNLGALADSAAEVVKLSSSNLTVTDNVNRNYVRRMKGESLFHTNTVRNSSYCEGLADSAALSLPPPF